MKLTKFQKNCDRNLAKLLSDLGRSVAAKRMDGETELYIYGEITGTHLHFYINEDGAEIGGPGLDLRYEAPDFDSLGDLENAFLQGIKQHAVGDD